MLRLSDAWAGYDDNPVLRGVDFEINPGEIITLVGLNGSGKSTLLKTLLGLIPLQKGSLILDGKNLMQWPLKDRAQKISLLESQPALHFPMSVEELLSLAARKHETSSAELLIKEALVTVGLEGFEEKNILELSSGEAKRAFVAHALCGNSKVIMLDEPLAHLDWRHQRELVESLKTWRARHQSTFVLALHELEWAVKLSDRLCVLHQGKIIKTGPPEEVLGTVGIREVFAFQTRIDENPIDGSKRLTLGHTQRRD